MKYPSILYHDILHHVYQHSLNLIYDKGPLVLIEILPILFFVKNFTCH